MQSSENSGLTISVVVCTYNRAGLLADALQSLFEQTLGTSYYEVIVVDNNSGDNTRAVTEEYCRKHANLRYCLETNFSSLQFQIYSKVVLRKNITGIGTASSSYLNFVRIFKAVNYEKRGRICSQHHCRTQFTFP